MGENHWKYQGKGENRRDGRKSYEKQGERIYECLSLFPHAVVAIGTIYFNNVTQTGVESTGQ